MRKKVIAGNWKMNNDISESQVLVSGIINGLGNDDKCDVIVCPPFTSLHEIHSLIKNTRINILPEIQLSGVSNVIKFKRVLTK